MGIIFSIFSIFAVIVGIAQVAIDFAPPKYDASALRWLA